MAKSLMGVAVVFAMTVLVSAGKTGYLADLQLKQRVETYRDSVTPVKALRYTVSLDDPPATRWHHVSPLFAEKAKAITAYFNEFLPPTVVPVLERIAADLRSFFPADYAAEMEANARDLNISVGEIVLVNLIYEVERIGNNCSASNTTGPCPPPKSDGPGLCTSIVAEDAAGKIVHGRNLDWSIPNALRDMMVDVEYTKDGVVKFVASQPVGFAGVLHGTVPHGFSYSMDAREKGGSLILNGLEAALIKGARTPTQHARMALESASSFADGVAALAEGPLVNPAYFIVGGVQSGEGAVISRGRDRAVDVWKLSEQTSDTKYFLLQTNYDHWEAPPTYDNRRDPGIQHMKAVGQTNVDSKSVFGVLTQWPTFNHHTDFTGIISADAEAAEYQTYIWP